MIEGGMRMAERTPAKTQSHAFAVLRASSKRLLTFIETEIARNGGGPVTLYADQFAVVGSVKVVVPGLSELHGLGLIDWQRHPKRHVISLSARWRMIETAKQAMIVSATARVQRMPLLPTPSQPASVSA
jgi:hypothetical protein